MELPVLQNQLEVHPLLQVLPGGWPLGIKVEIDVEMRSNSMV